MEKSTENSVGGLPSWMGPQGTIRIVIARLMETQTCQLCGEGLEKTTNGLCQLFCLEEYRPPPPISVPSPHPDDARQSSSSWCVPGCVGAAAPALDLRENQSN